ncbi:X2-like carbohydrate binding domain-containing protein [Streptomyces sp. NPDC002787]
MNGAAFKALLHGTTKLVKGRDYSLADNRLPLKSAALTRLVGDRSHGVDATLRAGFSRGVPWRNTAFAPDPAKKAIRLTPAFLDAVQSDTRVKLTFHFWSGATTTHYVTTSGSTVTGTTS